MPKARRRRGAPVEVESPLRPDHKMAPVSEPVPLTGDNDEGEETLPPPHRLNLVMQNLLARVTAIEGQKRELLFPISGDPYGDALQFANYHAKRFGVLQDGKRNMADGITDGYKL